jgi:hypothetical protein
MAGRRLMSFTLGFITGVFILGVVILIFGGTD